MNVPSWYPSFTGQIRVASILCHISTFQCIYSIPNEIKLLELELKNSKEKCNLRATASSLAPAAAAAAVVVLTVVVFLMMLGLA